MASPREVELRINITSELAQRIDAVVMAEGLTCRGDLVIPVLEELTLRKLHAATVLLRVLRINPLSPDARAPSPDSPMSPTAQTGSTLS